MTTQAVSNTALKLGYWNIRGLAQASRFLLEYTGLPWTEELYRQSGPDAVVPFDKSCWMDVKPTLGFDFPNLPYLIDGDFKITQSAAIMKHIARMRSDLQLAGRCDKDMSRVDMLLSEYSDKKAKMTILQYTAGLEGDGATFINGDGDADMKAHLTLFAKYLGSNNYFVGGQITLADFALYEYFTQCFEYSKAVGCDYRTLYPTLNAFCSSFEALPSIKAYLESSKYKEITGWNNQHAKFR